MINPFEEIKNRLTIQEVAEQYGIKILHNNKAICCFHEDTYPSMSFKNKNFFKCFVCEAKGSVISFVMRLFNLNALEAAKKLSKDFNLDLFEEKLTPKLREEIQKAIKKQEKCKFNIRFFERWKEKKENILCIYLKALNKIAKTPKLPEDENSEIFAFAQSELRNMTEPGKERWSTIEDMLEILIYKEISKRISHIF